MATYFSKIISNTFGVVEGKQLQPNIQTFPFASPASEDVFNEIPDITEKPEESGSTSVSERIEQVSEESNNDTEARVVSKPVEIKKEIIKEKVPSPETPLKEAVNKVLTDEDPQGKGPEQESISPKNKLVNLNENLADDQRHHVDKEKNKVDKNEEKHQNKDQKQEYKTINVTKRVSAIVADEWVNPEKPDEPTHESKSSDKNIHPEIQETRSKKKEEIDTTHVIPAKLRTDKVKKEVVEIEPQKPEIQPPPARVKKGKRLVIGQINVEVVQEQKEKQVQKETIIKYKAVPQGKNPTPAAKGSTLKIKYGLGQL